MVTSDNKAIELQDACGATVTVPADAVPRYVGAKAEQLTALTRLMVDATAGNVIEPSEKDLSILTLMINDLAHTVAELVEKVSISTKKHGGA